MMKMGKGGKMPMAMHTKKMGKPGKMMDKKSYSKGKRGKKGKKR